MMRWALPLLLVGCPKPNNGLVDLDLTDEGPPIERLPPMDILVEGAASLEPSHRGHALGFLIATDAAEGGGEWAPRALFDPDAWVQRQGILALAGRLDEPASREHLEAYVRSSSADPYGRASAAFRLRDHSSTSLRDALHDAWSSEPRRWKAAPLALAALVHGDEAAVEPLAAALSRGDVALEVEFLLDLGATGRAELLPALQEGEDWAEDELQLPYAVARMSLGDPSGEQLLRKALANDDAVVRLEALDYLSRLHDPAADALLRKARGGSTDLVRSYAELALAARGKADASVIPLAARSADADIRALAARFAGERIASGLTTSKRALRQLEEVLTACLLDADPEVRRGALTGIQAAQLTDREGLLAGALVDDSFANRLHAAGLIMTQATARARP